MNTKHTEVLAAWVVAFALIGAMAVHALLPRTTPRLEPGVTAVGLHRVAPQAAVAGETD
jgi:hypothetical protein